MKTGRTVRAGAWLVGAAGSVGVRRFARSVVAVGLGAAGLVAVASAGKAQASDLGFALPLNSYRDMAVANGYVFIDGLGEGVVVRNADGSAKTVIDEPTAMDVEASADGTRVYVALGASGPGIAVIDTTTLTEVARYATGTCTNTLAVQGDFLWYGRCTGPPYTSSIGVVDLSHPKPRITADIVGGYLTPPYLAASTALPGRLFAWQDAFSPSTVDAFDVSGTTLTPTGSVEGGTDVALTPDGQAIVVADRADYSQRYRASDLAVEQKYSTALTTSVVAAGPDGAVANGTQQWPPIVIDDGQGNETRSYNFDASGAASSMAPRGLLFADGGSTLYAVSVDNYDHSPTLHVFASPLAPLAPSQLTADSPAPIQYGEDLTMTGRLTSGGVPIANALVRLVSAKPYPDPYTVTYAHSTADGEVSLTWTGLSPGTWPYTWVYDGDDTHAAATASFTVVVNPAQTTMAVSTDRSTPYPYGAAATVTAHLGNVSPHDQVVVIYAESAGGVRTFVGSGFTDADGNLVTTYVMRQQTTFDAEYAGNPLWTASSAQVSVDAHTGITESLSGYYRTENSSRLFHASHAATFTARVRPNKASECVPIRIQRYTPTSWSTVSATCHSVDSTSRAQIRIRGEAGERYRVRAEFGGDAQNVATNGGWMHLKFNS